jgi:hypothetical protein
LAGSGCDWRTTTDKRLTTNLRIYATGNYSVAVHDVQRQELLHDEEPEDNAGSSGDEQVLPEVPQAHAA